MTTWYHFQLRFEHPAKWWIDIYLIDTVFRNIIAEHRNELKLWRFHRRSAPNEKGHQFSFLCYINETNVSQIESDIFEHPSVVFLDQNDLLLNKLNDNCGSNFEDTSDPNWPIEIQKSWPYYIMGVSEMLLNLIEQIKQSHSSYDDNDISSVESYYVELNNKLIDVWYHEGSHVFLHHLNALFGYFPLIARPQQVDGMNVIF
jgi:hypothetical protein